MKRDFCLLTFQFTFFVTCLAGVSSSRAFPSPGDKPRTEPRFFNGRDLTRWSASDMKYWSVQDGAILGRSEQDVPRNEFLWSEVEVTDFYLSLDVILQPGDRNAGIQFRSRKANASGQAQGYQADVGQGYWGKLYHEHDRKELDWTDRGEEAVKDGQWNHYEILAVGNHIWTAINGTLSVAIDDPGGELSGYIALQIHSGPPQTVKYRINKLVHHPKIKLAGLNQAQLEKELKAPLHPVHRGSLLQLRPNELVALTGGTNVANMRNDGFLETMLLAQEPTKKIRFRNLGWDGDTAYEQFRDVGFGDWRAILDSVGATLVLVQFGQMESLQGEDALPAFVAAYQQLLTSIRAPNRRIALISPIPFDTRRLPAEQALPDTLLDKYATAIRLLAESEGYAYIDLLHQQWRFEASRPYTTNGIHLNLAGQRLVASLLAETFGLSGAYKQGWEPLRQEVLKKNRLWFDYWRPGNWAFLGGDRTTQAFSHDWRDKKHRIFPEEIKAFQPLMEAAENRLEATALTLSRSK